MKTHVEFRTDIFPPYDGEENQINPGIWGKRLAEYLKAKLKENGINSEDICSEDWGYEIPIINGKYPFFLGCANYQEYENGFLVFINPSKPIIRKLFKKIDLTNEINSISEIIDKILSENNEIKNIRWWTEEESKT